MIRLGKDKTLDNYFIDENGVITDLNGNIQKVYFCGGDRPIFKGVPIHRIMMYTFYGYRDGEEWAIHHLDENKKNNSLNNLVYLTHSEHMRIHSLNRSEETKRKNSIAHLGNKNMYGKHHSIETKQKISAAKKGKHHSIETKQKMSESHKGKNTWSKGLHWFNDGIKNYSCKECPPGCVKGRLKWR